MARRWGKWKYVNDNGTYAADCWITDQGVSYYIDSNGFINRCQYGDDACLDKGIDSIVKHEKKIGEVLDRLIVWKAMS